MEDGFTYPESNFTSITNSKGGSLQGKGGFHGEKKTKWEKSPYNNKGKEVPHEKKWKVNVSSRKCYNCRSIRHLA
jgi:hypothetical protein